MNLIKKEWTKEDYQQYILYLEYLKEEEYAKFQQKLITTKYCILGIRVPIERKIAKEIMKGNYISFLKQCENHYYEEVNIEGFVIASIKEKEIFDEYFEKFLPKIDNWAICDGFCSSVKIIKKNQKEYFEKIKKLLNQEEFVVRVGLILFLHFYLEEPYIKDVIKEIKKIKREEYYINMAIAWLVCEMYIQYPNYALPLIQNNSFNLFTKRKIISKIHDSYRVSKEEKEHLLFASRKKV